MGTLVKTRHTHPFSVTDAGASPSFCS
jgi:hypothetical protein